MTYNLILFVYTMMHLKRDVICFIYVMFYLFICLHNHWMTWNLHKNNIMGFIYIIMYQNHIVFKLMYILIHMKYHKTHSVFFAFISYIMIYLKHIIIVFILHKDFRKIILWFWWNKLLVCLSVLWFYSWTLWFVWNTLLFYFMQFAMWTNTKESISDLLWCQR